MPEVTIQNPCQYPEGGARRLRPWIERLAASLCPAESSFVVRFVSDREMRQLNRAYRHLDKTTDVLSFPGEESLPGETSEPEHVGDIVISIPTARRQALAAGQDANTEVKVLILHGLLHCLGYDHETDDGEMDELEERLRREWIFHA